MEHYQVSRRTVRTAVDELCGQGCLVRKQGKGTFVSKPKLHRKIVNVLSFQDACDKCGMRAAHRAAGLRGAQSHAGGTAAVWPCCRGAGAADAAPAYGGRRTRDGRERHIPLRAVCVFAKGKFKRPAVPAFAAQGPVPVGTSTCHLEMVRADAENARLLGVPEGEPLFEMRSCLTLENGRPVTVSDNFIVASRYAFDIP